MTRREKQMSSKWAPAYITMIDDKIVSLPCKPTDRKSVRVSSIKKCGNEITVLPDKKSEPALTYNTVNRFLDKKQVTNYTKIACLTAIERLYKKHEQTNQR